jgi:hypothetical protein
VDRLETFGLKSDGDGRFRVEAAKNEKIVFWALPETLAPKYVFPDKKRGDLGNITVEKGFEPVITVLDKDGKPVQDVWVNIHSLYEEYGIAHLTPYARSAVTDQAGNARLRPIAKGDYEIRIAESPSEWSDDPLSIVRRATQENDKKPVKGVFFITPVKLSAASPKATMHGQKNVTIDVQFSDKTSDRIRDMNVNIHGCRDDNSFFGARPSSDSPSAYKGEGLFSFQVPIGLTKASLRVPSDSNTAYRAKLDGAEGWLEAEQGMDFPLGTIEKPMKIEVTVYKSPKMTLNVVNESGQPVKEYYAWLEYTKNGTPARIKFEGDKIRVDITPEHWGEIGWEWATSELPLGGILDVSFTYKDFGKSEAKINASGIIPDEEMRLHIVGKGYALAEQMIPKMAEGEERKLTVTLKK